MSIEPRYMQQAIDQARLCVSEGEPPRPKVGAVLVKDGQVLGQAHRGETGSGDHAEYALLEKKLRTDRVAQSTLYTTLEPCTVRKSADKIPCADRIISRRIAHVVIGMLDPNQSICGRGIRRLRSAGISTDLFPSELMVQVEEQNRDFIQYQETISASYPMNSSLPVVNPRYETDLRVLDKTYQLSSVLGNESLLIVTGENVVVELLDRVAAALLRDAIDRLGAGKQFRRAVIVTSAFLRANTNLHLYPVIAVGGPKANATTGEIITLAESKGKLRWREKNGGSGIFVREDGQPPRIALWGDSAETTRRAVQHYVGSADGLASLIKMVWDKG